MTNILAIALYIVVNFSGNQNVTLETESFYMTANVVSFHELPCIFDAHIYLSTDNNTLEDTDHMYSLRSYEDCSFNISKGFQG